MYQYQKRDTSFMFDSSSGQETTFSVKNSHSSPNALADISNISQVNNSFGSTKTKRKEKNSDQCFLCDLQFANSLDLFKHMMRFHTAKNPTQNWPYKCNIQSDFDNHASKKVLPIKKVTKKKLNLSFQSILLLTLARCLSHAWCVVKDFC